MPLALAYVASVLSPILTPRLVLPQGLAVRANRLCGVRPSPLAAIALA
jgi:hypothetical protein